MWMKFHSKSKKECGGFLVFFFVMTRIISIQNIVSGVWRENENRQHFVNVKQKKEFKKPLYQWTMKERRELQREAERLFDRQGSYGCTYKIPGLTCPVNEKGTNLPFPTITKLVVKSTISDELHIARRLMKIDPLQHRFLYLIPDTECSFYFPEQWRTTCTVRHFSDPGAEIVGYRLRYGGNLYGEIVSYIFEKLQPPNRLLWRYLVSQMIYMFQSLKTMHDNGLVHLDVSGNNIVMNPQKEKDIDDEASRPKFIDFGLSVDLKTLHKATDLHRFLGKYYARYPMELNVLAGLIPNERATSPEQLYLWMLTVWLNDPNKRFLWIWYFTFFAVSSPDQWKCLNECLKEYKERSKKEKRKKKSKSKRPQRSPNEEKPDLSRLRTTSTIVPPTPGKRPAVTEKEPPVEKEEGEASFSPNASFGGVSSGGVTTPLKPRPPTPGKPTKRDIRPWDFVPHQCITVCDNGIKAPILGYLNDMKHRWVKLLDVTHKWTQDDHKFVNEVLTKCDVYMLAAVWLPIWWNLEAYMRMNHLNEAGEIGKIKKILESCLHPRFSDRLTASDAIKQLSEIVTDFQLRMGFNEVQSQPTMMNPTPAMVKNALDFIHISASFFENK